jgi:hypothetical protein
MGGKPEINFRYLFAQLAVPADQTSGYSQNRARGEVFDGISGFKDGVNGFFSCGADEAAGVNKDKVGFFRCGSCDHSVAERSQHDFGIDPVFRTAEADGIDPDFGHINILFVIKFIDIGLKVSSPCAAMVNSFLLKSKAVNVQFLNYLFSGK